MIYAFGLVVTYLLQLVLKLDEEMTIIMLLFILFMIPFHQKCYEQSKANETRFHEVSMYLDTLLYAFVKEGKVDLAIRDVSLTLPEGKMKTLTEQAYLNMNHIFDESGVVENALHLIEKAYPCRRIKEIHQFMTHVEYYGGEIEKTVNLLLKDKSRWEQRIQKNIQERKKQMTDVILSVAASFGICGAMVYLPVGDMDISKEPVVSICTMLLVIVNELIIYRAQRYLNVDWTQLQLMEEDDYYANKMEHFEKYDEDTERNFSIMSGMVGCIVTVVVLGMKKEWLALVCMGVTLFLFQQHKIGRNIERTSLEREIKYAFPNWLMDLVLLLQSENVQVALQKSKEYVPAILRKELFRLTERLEMEPESSTPYHAFLQEFAIPEVHSAMGILYSVSIGNSGNVDKQMSELVEKNLELLDVSETQKLRASASGLYALFLLPVVCASFKLIVDMIFMMFYFIQVPMI